MPRSRTALFVTLVALVATTAPAVAQSPTDALPVPDTATRVRVIDVAGRPHGAVSRDGGRTWTRQGEVDHRLHLRFGIFDPRRPPVIPLDLHATAANRLFLVQFETPIIREFRAVLRGLGAEIHRYLPSQTYLVRMDRATSRRVADLAVVRAVLDYHTAFRLDPAIIVGWGRAPTPARYTIALVDKRRDAAGLEQRAIDLGGRRETTAGGGMLFEATLTEAQLLALANDDRTLFIEPASAIGFDIDNARIQGGTNQIEAAAGIRGAGVTGHVSEGVYPTHPEFAAIANVRAAPIALFNGASSSHGSNTAGEIYAQGVNSRYRGLMPHAQMTFTNSTYAGSNRYSMTQSMQRTNLVMLDTASWGFNRTLLYTNHSAEMDDIIFDLDMFITQSQSNAGSTTQPRASRPQAWAKNICSVGGFRHRDNSLAGDDYWGRSGSTGPAADGRIGVTLAAYYDLIGTAHLTSSYRNDFGGTSGATPIINGLGGNMIEMFTDGLFGYRKAAGQTARDRFPLLPHFTTTKALLVATANQVPYDASGVSRGANRYQQGFGMPSVSRAHAERDRMLVLDELDVLRQGESRTYYVLARGGRLVAAMQYADPPAAPNAAIHRINSVDLAVTTSNGTRYWGNNGLLSGPYSTPGGSANDLDTEEAVILDSAPPGLVTVQVRATGVRLDGHVQTPGADVDYALVVQGLHGLRDRTGLSLDLASSSPGQLSATVSRLPATGWDHGFTILSLDTSRPLSTGAVLGVEPDQLTMAIFQVAPAAGDVFHFTPGTASQYPQAPYAFPAPLAAAVMGRTLDGVVCLLKGGVVTDTSNVSRVTVR